MKRNNYIRHMSYLRNSIAYDYDFLVHLCKMMISVFFLFFQNFYFLGCYWVKRTKNGPKQRKVLSAVHHISGTMHRMIVIYGTLV